MLAQANTTKLRQPEGRPGGWAGHKQPLHECCITGKTSREHGFSIKISLETGSRRKRRLVRVCYVYDADHMRTATSQPRVLQIGLKIDGNSVLYCVLIGIRIGKINSDLR